jgi:N-acetylmuramate 1-kinase
MTSLQVDERKQALQTWIAEQVQASVTLQCVSGDASARRYFRFYFQGISHIAVDAPPATENNVLFQALAEAYAKQGLKVPTVRSLEVNQGFMWLEDLGDCLLAEALNATTTLSLYQDALACLPAIRTVQMTTLGALPAFDAAMMHQEMDLLETWFVQGFLQHRLNSSQQQQLAAVKSLLVAAAVAQPQVGMHRDFHSRNLMLVEQRMAVIDFQGAVRGPITYDLVSLLKDVYQPWDKVMAMNLLKTHYNELCQTEQLSKHITWDDFLRWFDWMGLQRHLKILGIFARLSLRDQKHQYLQDIPLTMKYVLDAAQTYSELQWLSDWLIQDIMPRWEQRCDER